tara:strand:+ start:902 stop:2248 length:1347 start_codon:yes stop_codon:yes gene_type:complete
MPYKKANRHLTKEQFSEGTTIDGTRIDKAIEDIIEHQNEIPTGDMEARWMPTTYTLNFNPVMSHVRHYVNSINTPPASHTRMGICQTDQIQDSWFPFLMSHNGPSEVFPSDEQPPWGFTNEYRSKGYYTNYIDWWDEQRARHDVAYENYVYGPNQASEPTFQQVVDTNNVNSLLPSLIVWDNRASLIPEDAGTRVPDVKGAPKSAQFNRFMTMTIPFYFAKPVIITNISVFAAQEHPISYYNGMNNVSPAGTQQPTMDANDGLKASEVLSAAYEACDSEQPTDPVGILRSIEVQRENVADAQGIGTLPTKTGLEVPGELFAPTQRNWSDGTVQISIDDSFLKENRQLNNIVFNKTNFGDAAYRFNLCPTTANRTGVGNQANDSGAQYQDMSPRFSGGPTWGVWMKEDDLNIPVPRDSRVRLQVICKGTRPVRIFDWHIAITVLEQVED